VIFLPHFCQKVCHNVKVEPNLQPLTGEELRYRTAVCDDDARLDIRAAGFWVLASKMHFLMFVFLIL